MSTFDKVKEVIDKLGIEDSKIESGSSFVDLGADSLTQLNLLCNLKKSLE